MHISGALHGALPVDAFDGVVEWENVDTLTVGYVATSVHRDNVAQANMEVLAYDLIKPNLRILGVLVREHDADCILPFLPLDQHIVSTTKVQLLHFRE